MSEAEVAIVQVDQEEVDEGPPHQTMKVVEWVQDFDDFAARGRVPDCNCGLIICVCLQVRPHKLYCMYRKSMTCPVAIPCDCGFDVCPKCDPCTCEGPDQPEPFDWEQASRDAAEKLRLKHL
jgi:hypothetical protein